jgi:hypothetical protein
VAAWLESAAGSLADASPTLLQRYHLLQSLLNALGATRAQIEEMLSSISPLQRFPDADAEQRERWEDELEAAVEAEYRRRRGEFLAGVHAWLRDLWMLRIGSGTEAALPRLTELSARISERLSVDAARANLERWERTQRLLSGTNAQEALVLEVGLLRLSL